MENITEIITKERARNINPLALAFYGDAVYEKLVRRRLVTDCGLNVRKLHAASVEKVRASFQSAAAGVIEPILSDEESDIMRRGRNAKSNVPKSASVGEYHRATGLEALFGYLSLIGEESRVEELFTLIVEN